MDEINYQFIFALTPYIVLFFIAAGIIFYLKQH